MRNKTFSCIDAHTCGNPVRVVTGGIPFLEGSSMMDKRLHFLENFDWIRKSLMFEPRGHDMMSGSMILPPSSSEYDCGVLFIETSGCLPMCGHGTIGSVTVAIENGLVNPKQDGVLVLETPAGKVIAEYKKEAKKVKSVKIVNVPSFLHSKSLTITSPHLGELEFDVSFGGNFYAIINPQTNFKGLENYSSLELITYAPILREEINKKYEFNHPLDKNIKGVSHILYTGKVLDENSTARNAVFYGDKAIDRSPCGTGTSSVMAQRYSKGLLKKSEEFIHESIIGSKFIGRIEGITKVGEYEAIIPSIEGWARVTGYNTIIVDEEDDPYYEGFSVK